MNKKVLIIIGAAKYNKGSEILLAGTVQLAKKAGADYIAVSSADISKGENLFLPLVDKYIPRYSDFVKKTIVRKLFNFLSRFAFLMDIMSLALYAGLINEAKNYGAIILIAADNFDYNKRRNFLNSMINILRKKTEAKILLYDFSINKDNITKYLLKDWQKVNLLTARDSLSFQNLKNAGITNVEYCPDPAFTVKPEFIESADIPNEVEYVGINLSNLILAGDKSKKILNAYFGLIENIIFKKNLSVLLIPHVFNGADLSALEVLYEKYKKTKKVFIVKNEQLNARQLKYIISRCRFFIGARTHATIGAYSSCVPTLVVGYSIKSKGIAKDLFGTHKNYVINAYDISGDELSDGFEWLYKNENEVRNRLQKIMPEYINKAESVSEIIAKLLK
ncbi:polysaccharide pyruvyl transferase family protein [Elusimicrobiota bacterium]